ncbi:uncharacterized protein UV8b_01266 [Ustilaginoidea virens]|uniref:Uncharacterized protein n=1 Tax=Ustilaginoidea virens TaxID=1159556 RepID=A0A8E5HKM8_USTVR|nr:uncharacterized protein UV8b_01266 [Ustilaginoidea virens]QUC17025.1 hypothetical protein UV8b_01266 [Ustilaginoidea virens]
MPVVADRGDSPHGFTLLLPQLLYLVRYFCVEAHQSTPCQFRPLYVKQVISTISPPFSHRRCTLLSVEGVKDLRLRRGPSQKCLPPSLRTLYLARQTFWHGATLYLLCPLDRNA